MHKIAPTELNTVTQTMSWLIALLHLIKLILGVRDFIRQASTGTSNLIGQWKHENKLFLDRVQHLVVVTSAIVPLSSYNKFYNVTLFGGKT